MLLIKNGRVIDPLLKTETIRDLWIEHGKIKAAGGMRDKNVRVIDASGLAVAPGLVDIHVHFREPGFTYKEDVASGARAAAKGGFTTVVCMANTKPAIDNEMTLREVLDAAAKTNINVLTVAAVTMGLQGDVLTRMGRLKAAGAVGFSDDGMPIVSTAVLRSAMLEAKRLGAVISLHEEDPRLISCAGINKSAPAIAESAMVARDCMLALDTGARVHIQHISCTESVALIRFAKLLGANVTSEVTPQHFSLTEDAVGQKAALAKLNPPLRTEKDRQSLINGLMDGTIDVVATDHAPHSAEEKSRPIQDAPSGMIGLETALALGITNLVKTGHMTLPELIDKMTAAPARVFELDAGSLEDGANADIVMFDDRESFTVNGFASKSSNSPFTGMKLDGVVKCTVCGGKIVYENWGGTV